MPRKAVLAAVLVAAAFVLPAAAGPASGPLSVVAYSQRTVTVSWASVAGTGFDLYVNGAKVATAGKNATQAKFAAASWGTYTFGVGALSTSAPERLYTITVQGEWVATAQTQPAPAPVTTTTPAPPAGPSANLWVAPGGGSCTRQAPAGQDAAGKACGSFSAAFNAASCGDTVGVEAGSYGTQGVSTAKGCTTPVTFVAEGAVTLTGELDVGQNASYVSFIGISVPHVFVLGSHVLLKDGQIGPNDSCATGLEDGLQVWDNGSVSASYVTVDGETIHDVSDHGNECAGFPNSGIHDDCVQLLGPNNVTIENSRFYNCATSDVIGRPYTTPLHDILIANNMMGPVVTPGASINLGSTGDVCNNVQILNNTVVGTWPSMVCSGKGSAGNVVVGNIFPGYYPAAGYTSSYNVTQATAASGTGSKQCTPSFAGQSPGSYDLSPADKCAKDLVPATGTLPPTDIHGTARPQGAGVDAGADEVG